MPDQFEHYITKNIKAFYKRRLLTPILYLIFLLVLWFVLSLSAPLFPDTLDASDTLESTYRRHEEYVSATLSDLKFTGYTQSFLGHISGYYYYTMRNDECIIVLLSPNTSEQGLPEIPQVSVRAKILHGSENFDELLNHLASDLNWTENGIHNKVSQYVLSEPDYNLLGNTLLYVVFFATGGYARNKEMVARYPVAHYFSNVPHGNVGDGLTAAEKIGALNYEHPAVQVVYTSLTCGIGINDESGLIVNDRGERVVNEWSYQYTVSDAIARSGSNCGWYITSGKEPYGGVQYGYKSAVAGKSKDPCATSIEGLAKKMGCDPATLQATYDRYCELVEKGVDEDFGKPAEFLHPIKGPKFVALRMHPCVTVTFGGLETDVSARVMKPDGSVIPHLYAAGEVAGTGMYGTQYPTCGTSIGSALFYGRIAGRAVTDQALL